VARPLRDRRDVAGAGHRKRAAVPGKRVVRSGTRPPQLTPPVLLGTTPPPVQVEFRRQLMCRVWPHSMTR
jgi:hypothetical protein